jgi:molecular chaperone GrpE
MSKHNKNMNNAPQSNENEEKKNVEQAQESKKPQEAKEPKKEETTVKGGNKKIEELENELTSTKEALEKEKALVAKDKDDYVRLLAEFDTFRRRTDEEKLQLKDSAIADFIKGMLPVLDSCEQALKMLEKSDNATDKEGINLIYTSIMSYLKSKGLEPIKAKDEKFDTDFHEAVAQVPVEDEAKKGMVYDVVQTGYTLSGKVIRYAKVVVGI